MSNFVNMTCNVVYKGIHYRGVSIQSGVTIDFEAMPCVAEKTRVVFGNTSSTVNVFVEGITSVEEHMLPCAEYLLIAVA